MTSDSNDTDCCTIAILLLLFIAVGMIVSLIILPKNIYHGPKAVNEVDKIHYDKKNKKCIKFNVVKTKCGTINKLCMKIANHLQNIASGK